jgi:cyclopropane-fatty-acyl-phospholipid synthase
MLDEGLTPSCGIWTRDDQTLEEAQTAKYDAICRTLRLKPTDLVLEVGSSWGGLACHAVKKYGCHVTTLARSKAEHDYCRERFVREGVGDNAAVRREDFLALEGRFDKIVSLEGLDTVGERRVDDFFAQCHELLKHHGLVALQFVTCPDSRYRDLTHGLDWVQKHVNPAERPLSLGRVTEALQRETDLQLFELRDLGLHYVRTLREWRRRFQANRDAVRQLKLDDRFIRQWHYYLCYREALFAQRNASVVHAVYTRPHNRTLMAPPPAASPASA